MEEEWCEDEDVYFSFFTFGLLLCCFVNVLHPSINTFDDLPIEQMRNMSCVVGICSLYLLAHAAVWYAMQRRVVHAGMV